MTSDHHNIGTDSSASTSSGVNGQANSRESRGDYSPLLRYRIAEIAFAPIARRAIRISPLLGSTVNDGLYLRAAVGDGWLSLPVAAIVLSVIGLVTNHGAVTPPSFWITLTLTIRLFRAVSYHH